LRFPPPLSSRGGANRYPCPSVGTGGPAFRILCEGWGFRRSLKHVYRPLRMAEICRRASAQATGFTLPESNPCMRRAISFCHSASANSSTVSSRLSRSEPAKAARAAGGKASALLSNSQISSVTAAFLPPRASRVTKRSSRSHEPEPKMADAHAPPLIPKMGIVPPRNHFFIDCPSQYR
jgi:hypothetical protein